MSPPKHPEDALGAPPDDLGGVAPSRIVETLVLRFLACVVHADRVVHPNEVALLLRVAATMEMPDREARRILDDELATRSDPELLARQIAEPDHRRSIYALGCTMALSEGELADSEREVLRAFARGAEIAPAEAEAILAGRVAATKD